METLVVIDGFSKKGRGAGCHGTAKVEVVGAVPGDHVLVELSRKRKGWHTGFLREIICASALRVKPRCAHVPLCGGCSWQEIDYKEQLRFKEEIVKKIFPAVGDKLRPIIACDDPWHYRNKMEFSFSQNKAGERFLGLMLAQGRSHVFNLTECHLVSSWFSELLSSIRAWWEKSELTAYRMNGEGTLRTLIVREGKRTQEKLVMLTVSGNPDYALTQKQIDDFAAVVESVISDASIFLRIQQAIKGTATQFYEIHLRGKDYIKEELLIDTGRRKRALTFKISPTSFFQPNPTQAEKLYSAALQMVDLPPNAVVFDLYAGTSTLGMALSLEAEKVVSIELNPHAVFDAEEGAKMNGIENLSFHIGDVGKVLTEMRSLPDFKAPDLVIVDPPRAGLDPTALGHLIALQPNQILYISCNVATQAQNIEVLQQEGYTLIAMQPVDQFAHTPHIENIALLKI
ncbi:MAG: 23S rRNA (uracil(1939)-C(5))-methyltransferase RlmD [Chlamydiota bacterium]